MFVGSCYFIVCEEVLHISPVLYCTFACDEQVKKLLLCGTISWRLDEQSVLISLIYFYWEAVQYFNRTLPIYGNRTVGPCSKRFLCRTQNWKCIAGPISSRHWKDPSLCCLHIIVIMSNDFTDVTMAAIISWFISMMKFYLRTFGDTQTLWCGTTTDMHAWASPLLMQLKSNKHTTYYCRTHQRCSVPPHLLPGQKEVPPLLTEVTHPCITERTKCAIESEVHKKEQQSTLYFR